jgi:hypothetical protein
VELQRRRELVSYLINCSKVSLSHFYLKQLNQSKNLEREFREVSKELVESVGVLNLVELLREHGEELVSHSSIPKEGELFNGVVQHWHWIFRDPAIKNREKLVLMAMNTFRANNGEIRATAAKLARACSYNAKTVRRAWHRLEKQGILLGKRTGRGIVYVIKPTKVYFDLEERRKELQQKQPALPVPAPSLAAPKEPEIPDWARERDARNAAVQRELTAGAAPEPVGGIRVKRSILDRDLKRMAKGAS